MILTLIGLIFSFVGSIILIADSILSFGKPRTIINPIRWDEKGKIKKFSRLKPRLGGGYDEVKISKEEIMLIISLSLISLGFLLQILDYLIQNFLQFFQFLQ